MREFLIDQRTLIRNLHTDAQSGLTDEQAAQSAIEHGTNTLTRPPTASMLRRIWHATTEPMILMLIAAGVIALGVNLVHSAIGGGTDFLECVGIFAAIALCVAITVLMESKSADAFAALNRINEDGMVKARREGKTILLHQGEVVVGDILLLAAGDKIPADGRLLESMGLSCDESALTGESLPAPKEANRAITDATTPLAERANMLYSGTWVASGFGKLLVTAVGDKTEFGKIAMALSAEKKSATPLQEMLDRLGKTITLFGIAAAAIVLAAQLIFFARSDGLVFEEVMEAFLTSIVLIVAIVPEGLPTIVAVSLSINIIKLAKRHALVKKLIASETVGCVNVICSDKTGTLTENRMTVVSEIDNAWILRNICINSTADIGESGAFIGNATECALLAAAGKAGLNYRQCRRDARVAYVFPFSSEEKDMTTLVARAEGVVAYTKGSPEKVFRSCSLPEAERMALEQQMAAHQQKARRIIAFAHREYAECPAFDEATVESGMVFDGFVAISDPLRADVREAVGKCRAAGIELKILTGDNIVTAIAIAEELDLLDENHIAVEARELAALSDDALGAYLPEIAVIARSTPSVKLRVVRQLQAMGNVVAVTGDGINDAPALKNADVGIAMGIAGTEVSREASDIVLLNDAFSTIVSAIEWGRGIYENFKRFICFQLTVNVSSVIVVLISILLGFKAPFTALQLLWISIIMDGPPALTLGVEPAHVDLMQRAPVKRSENILSRALLTRIAITGGYISLVFLLQYAFNFLQATETQMPTVLFTLFALFQLFNAFNCRELDDETIFTNLLKNKIMLQVIGITFGLQVVIIQFAGDFFGTIPLPLGMWAKLFAVAASVVVLAEVVKLIRRRWGKKLILAH